MKIPLLAILAIATLAGNARAGVSVVIQSETLSLSQQATTGFFDVYVSASGTNPTLSAWQVGVMIPANPMGLSLGVPIATDASSPARTMLISSANFVSPIQQLANTPTSVSATDYLGSGSTTIVDGTGLMRVPFTLAPGTTGTFQLEVNTDDNTGVYLADPSGNEIPYTAVNGTITINTPEPAAGIIFLLISAAGLRRRHRGSSVGSD